MVKTNMLSKIDDLNKNIYFFLGLIFLFSLLLYPAIDRSIQVSFENALYHTGYFDYTHYQSAYSYYLSNTWSLMIQISTFLLHLGFDIQQGSAVILALESFLGFGGLFLLIYAVSNQGFLSFLLSFFIHHFALHGSYFAYPMFFLGHSHTFGVLGQLWVLFTLGLLANRFYSISIFFAISCLALHAAWGVFLFSALICTLGIGFLFFKSAFKTKNLISYSLAASLGSVIVLLSYYWQTLHNQPLPVLEKSLREPLLSAYLQNWDYHRFFHIYDLRQLIHPHFFIASVSVLIALLLLFQKLTQLKKNRNEFESLPLFEVFLLSSFVISVIFCTLFESALAQKFVLIKSLMPYRFFNIFNLICYPLVFGYLIKRRNQPSDIANLTFATFLIFAFFMAEAIFSKKLSLKSAHVLFCALLIFNYILDSNSSVKNFYQKKLKNLPRVLMSLISVPPLVIFFRFVWLQHWPHPLWNSQKNVVSTNDLFTEKMSQSPGQLLTYGNTHLINLAYRRTVLLDGGALDFIPYQPNAIGLLENELTTLYGFSVTTSNVKNAHSGDIAFDHQVVWEKRTTAEWTKLKKTFDISQVLAPTEWQLNLPRIATSGKLTLFQIP